jgi:hypothetical protein
VSKQGGDFFDNQASNVEKAETGAFSFFRSKVDTARTGLQNTRQDAETGLSDIEDRLSDMSEKSQSALSRYLYDPVRSAYRYMIETGKSALRETTATAAGGAYDVGDHIERAGQGW